MGTEMIRRQLLKMWCQIDVIKVLHVTCWRLALNEIGN